MTPKPKADSLREQIDFILHVAEYTNRMYDEHETMFEALEKLERILDELPKNMGELTDIRKIVRKTLLAVRP